MPVRLAHPRVRRESTPMALTEEPTIELNVSPEKVCYIIIKAREFDAKVEPGEREALADYADDPTLAELRAAIDNLNDDEVIEVIALAWLGRGDFTATEWEDARALARERHRHHSAAYLTGIPMLGDYLEEGLSAVGYSCENDGLSHL